MLPQVRTTPATASPPTHPVPASAAARVPPPAERKPAVTPPAPPPPTLPPRTAPPAHATTDEAASDDRRNYDRLEIPVNLFLRRLDASGGVSHEEQTLADNIGRGGARVMTGIADAAPGEVFEISELGGDFQTRAVVRGTAKGVDHIQRLNLEFLERPAPPRLSGSNAAWSAPGGAVPETQQPAPPPQAAATPAQAAPPMPPATQNVKPRPPRPPISSQATGDHDLDALQERILQTYDGMKERTYYDLLGVGRNATPDEINVAYGKLARQFHPDRVVQHGLEGLKTPANSIFIRLGEARSILTDRNERAWYDRKNPASRPTASATPEKAERAPETSQAETAPPRRPLTFGEEDIATALAEAKDLFKAQKYWDVIQKLENVLPLAKQATQKQAIWLLLARATIKNPKWLKRGEEILRQIVQENPKNLEAHLLLANIYRDGSLKARALREYRAILQLDPGHGEAAQAIAALEAED
jgi:hypothetical protein